MAACPECSTECPEGALACPKCKHRFGRTLQEELETGVPTLARTFDIACGIATSLASMHDAKVAHKDLRPANLYHLKRPGQPDSVKILKTKEDRPADAPKDYCAPEELSGKPSDALSNIYSYGVILHECACGQRPGKEVKLPAEVPAALQDLINDCINKSPLKRPQTMRELDDRVSALRVAFRSGVLTKPPEPPAPSSSGKWVVLVLVLGLLGGGGYFAYIKFFVPPPPPIVVVPPPPAVQDAAPATPAVALVPDGGSPADGALGAATTGDGGTTKAAVIPTPPTKAPGKPAKGPKGPAKGAKGVKKPPATTTAPPPSDTPDPFAPKK